MSVVRVDDDAVHKERLTYYIVLQYSHDSPRSLDTQQVHTSSPRKVPVLGRQQRRVTREQCQTCHALPESVSEAGNALSDPVMQGCSCSSVSVVVSRTRRSRTRTMCLNSVATAAIVPICRQDGRFCALGKVLYLKQQKYIAWLVCHWEYGAAVGSTRYPSFWCTFTESQSTPSPS